MCLDVSKDVLFIDKYEQEPGDFYEASFTTSVSHTYLPLPLLTFTPTISAADFLDFDFAHRQNTVGFLAGLGKALHAYLLGAMIFCSYKSECHWNIILEYILIYYWSVYFDLR